jgi:hypothetical protein
VHAICARSRARLCVYLLYCAITGYCALTTSQIGRKLVFFRHDHFVLLEQLVVLTRAAIAARLGHVIGGFLARLRWRKLMASREALSLAIATCDESELERCVLDVAAVNIRGIQVPETQTARDLLTRCVVRD